MRMMGYRVSVHTVIRKKNSCFCEKSKPNHPSHILALAVVTLYKKINKYIIIIKHGTTATTIASKVEQVWF
jgi:hypothetical protein